jgi:hypothetical protein
MRRPEDPAFSNDLPSPPSFHWLARSELPIPIGEDRLPRLSEPLLWAFGLREGDLLTVFRDGIENGSYHFESYSRAVRFAREAIADPWLRLKHVLVLPMATLGPQGRLHLPQEAASLIGPAGKVLRLSVEPHACQGVFHLEPAHETISTPLHLEIRYVLPVEKGYIRVPADLRSVGGLDAKLLACWTRMGIADFAVLGLNEPLDGRDLIALGPAGSLLLPATFLRDLRPEWQVLLSARIAPEPSFRLTYYAGEALFG